LEALVIWSFAAELQLGEFQLDVALEGGQSTVALIGANGSGKSTVLRLIAGAYRAKRGRIEVAERCLFDAQQGVDLPPEERRIGYVPQGFGLFPHLNALENVAFGLPGPKPQRRVQALEMLESLDAADFASLMPNQLSGGQAQTVSLARALVVEPSLLLLDEPFAALDVVARRALRGRLADLLKRRDLPTLIVSHDRRDLEPLQPMVYALEKGRVLQSGKLESLSEAPQSAFVAEFFGVD
jgi:molybdate transport system ATP-binding protein